MSTLRTIFRFALWRSRWTILGWVGALVWAAVGKRGLWSADFWSTKKLSVILLGLLSHGPLAAQGAWTYESGTGGGSVYTEPAGGGSMLLVSCAGNRPVVLFHTGGYTIGDRLDRVRVTYRVDQNTAVGPRLWSAPGDGSMAIMPNSQVGSFLRAARTGRGGLFESTDPATMVPRRYRFSLMGLTAALRRLRCT